MVGKNILLILGGGRPRGNTFPLSEAFMSGVRDSGHHIELEPVFIRKRIIRLLSLNNDEN